MKIRVRCGDAEILYEEPTEVTHYPKITTKDKVGGEFKYIVLMSQVKNLCELVSAMNNEQYK